MTEELTSKEKSLSNLRPFVKGDPRINRNGRPKAFDALRAVAHELANEIAKDKSGNPVKIDGKEVTVAEMILNQMARDPKQRAEFLEIAFGKVPIGIELDNDPQPLTIIFEVSQPVKEVEVTHGKPSSERSAGHISQQTEHEV